MFADFSSKYDVFTSLFNNISLYWLWAFSIFSPQTMRKNSFVDWVKCILVKVLITGVTVLSIFILTHPISCNYIWPPPCKNLYKICGKQIVLSHRLINAFNLHYIHTILSTVVVLSRNIKYLASSQQRFSCDKALSSLYDFVWFDSSHQQSFS